MIQFQTLTVMDKKCHILTVPIGEQNDVKMFHEQNYGQLNGMGSSARKCEEQSSVLSDAHPVRGSWEQLAVQFTFYNY